MHNSPNGFAVHPGHLQGVDDQLGAQVISDRPADHAAGVDIQHDRAVHPPAAGAVLGDVGDPQPVGAVGDEPPVDVIGPGRHVPHAGTAPPAPVHSLQR